jgi:hypothetical protein
MSAIEDVQVAVTGCKEDPLHSPNLRPRPARERPGPFVLHHTIRIAVAKDTLHGTRVTTQVAAADLNLFSRWRWCAEMISIEAELECPLLAQSGHA